MASVVSKGKTALITGASSGIGEAFAETLASKGMDLILVARSGDALQALATKLHLKHGIQADTLAQDLAAPGGVDAVASYVASKNLSVDLLVNNAGFGVHGRFLDSDYERQRGEVTLNVLALTDLIHAFLPAMKDRKSGAIINVASTAALQPLPYMAVYGATKAYVLSLSEALAVEVKDLGIVVQALCPGNTDTPFHKKVGESDGRVGSSRTPQDVVDTSLSALAKEKSMVIDGFANRLLAVLPRIVSRHSAAKIAGQLMSPDRKK